MMKLSVATLDNKVKSAVICIGANSGYIEAYIEEGQLKLYVFDKEGEAVLERFIPIKTMQAKGGWTAPKVEPAEEHYEGDPV